ncbi:sulfite reductase subunit alpha [Salinisphaera sp. Q1T1-3]|uniref:sulfite reductase subunit alpha n=1 Tax=Salinisphaera sp. Q1T1-3 TaxID=2321229 RepID=UPI000E75C925|nr:sulfite reductase subunit alpha [Salinisphaera sp. Q1T1-3]RJS93149.1 sulfite reductase subunit alpha [Salinisphaera sp. Q1T1-3]
MSTPVNLIPEDAPFDDGQREWLNGLIAALAGWEGALGGAEQGGGEAKETFPWHDPAMALDERMALAEGKPYERQLMAAMAQLDCGQCGYLCKTYAEAIAFDGEALNRCVPGAKETERQLKALAAEHKAESAASATDDDAEEKPAPQPKKAAPLGTRDNPLMAKLKSSTPLNAEGSTKDTRHVVIDLGGSGVAYTAGDSMGIFPENDPRTVDAILADLDVSGGETVTVDGEERLFRQALLKDRDVTKPSDEVIALLAEHAADADEAEDLKMLAGRGAEEGQTLLELVRVYPSARPTVQALVDELGPLQPRLYSIASSSKQYPDEIHTTVAVVKTAVYGRGYKGVASTYLAKRLSRHGEVPIYIQKSDEFRVNADPDHPAIMIGPGTGIAPFLAFLQEREALGHAGRNWLFFGNPESARDHIYRDQLDAWRKQGLISRLTLAFSRDQDEKVYVQTRMLEQAWEFWAWLQAGAVIYICGDASRMAKDVDDALHRIVAEQGAMDEKAAARYVTTLSENGRYLRDVY